MKALIRGSIFLIMSAAGLVLLACGNDASSDTTVATPAASSHGDTYAPVLELPAKLPDDPGIQMLAMMQGASVMPKKADVDIPLYPDAKLIAAMPGMEMSANGETIVSWPTFSMLSGDEVSTVATFYKAKLAGWQHDEMFGLHNFWDGGEGTNPLDISGQFALVSLTPIAEDDAILQVWPSVRTKIDVRYAPPE